MTDPPNDQWNELVRLMEKIENPDDLTDVELADAFWRLQGHAKTVEAEAVRTARLLRARGWSWRQIGQYKGVDHAAVYRWVQRRSTAADPIDGDGVPGESEQS